jgi:methionyl-tRNA formyltransferase
MHVTDRAVNSQTLPPEPPEPPESPLPNVLLFGIRCQFTEHVAALLRLRGHRLLATVLPGERHAAVPVRLTPPRSVPMAGRPAHPVYQVGNLSSPETLGLVASLRPDVIVVACFPRRLPQALYDLARLAALNIHPSLLPAGRGPDPLFWTLRCGDGRSGVTVHGLTETYDAGPIYAQAVHHYEDGTSETALERQLATLGAELTHTVIVSLGRGACQSVPQDERLASYQPWPGPEDYVLDTQCSARSAFNFVNGIAARGHPILLRMPDGTWEITAALAWHDDVPLESPEPGATYVPFARGVLVARLAEQTAGSLPE